MGTVIRRTDRAEAVVRLPAERNPRGKHAAPTPPAVQPLAAPRPPMGETPGGVAPTLDAELTHLSAVAAATITDTERGSLLEEAVKAAQASAEQELVRLREEACARGYQEGLSQGQEEGRKAWDEKFGRLGQIADELRNLHDEVLTEAEDKLVELVFEATARILGETLTTRDGVAAVIRQVLAATRDQTSILTIRIAPADYELLGGTEESAPKVFRPGVAVVADTRVHVGGCLLDTTQGSIDGRLEIQLERLKDAILEARRGQRK